MRGRRQGLPERAAFGSAQPCSAGAVQCPPRARLGCEHEVQSRRGVRAALLRGVGLASRCVRLPATGSLRSVRQQRRWRALSTPGWGGPCNSSLRTCRAQQAPLEHPVIDHDTQSASTRLQLRPSESPSCSQPPSSRYAPPGPPASASRLRAARRQLHRPPSASGGGAAACRRPAATAGAARPASGSRRRGRRAVAP